MLAAAKLKENEITNYKLKIGKIGNGAFCNFTYSSKFLIFSSLTVPQELKT